MATQDVLAKLLAPFWRTVPFPLVKFNTELSQDQVEHKMPDADGAHVEATGRNNLVISATIPFRNGVTTGPSEAWHGRVLYPDLFREFFSACADKTSGPLVHPELGRLTCKCKSMRWDYDPMRRDGVDVDVSWTESRDESDNIAGYLAQPSPVAEAATVAQDLDLLLEQYARTRTPIELDDGSSFTDLITGLQSIPDTITLTSQRIGGYLSGIAAKLDRLDAAIKRVNDVSIWPIVQGAEHLRHSVNKIAQQPEKTAPLKRLVVYRVRRDTTVAQLARLLKQRVDELIRINPDLSSDPVVTAGTEVRYYVTIR